MDFGHWLKELVRDFKGFGIDNLNTNIPFEIKKTKFFK